MWGWCALCILHSMVCILLQWKACYINRAALGQLYCCNEMWIFQFPAVTQVLPIFLLVMLWAHLQLSHARVWIHTVGGNYHKSSLLPTKAGSGPGRILKHCRANLASLMHNLQPLTWAFIFNTFIKLYPVVKCAVVMLQLWSSPSLCSHT